MTINYPQSDLSIRDDLIGAQARFWEHLAAPGTWLSGAERVAIAAEARGVRNCDFCKIQKDALSPNSIQDTHQSSTDLAPNMVEVIHRIVSDPGRLTEAWVRGVVDSGISDGAYVETVGLIATAMVMDTFAAGIGHDDVPLPAPAAGEPSRYTSSGAKRAAAWVPITEPEDITEEDGDLYPGRSAYIQRALSSVPDTKRGYWDLAVANYLPAEHMPNFDTDFRAISRNQIELIAARTSALHGCAY
ncbi:MAG: hypothetical protein HN485_12560 [Rhodospirillaceae bacterium]|nr:hypothetical protein [Rhodospirillaceae bacterium]MBT4720567.1 hypothetical protein [Rhodospirillaceae bacterium]